MYDNRVNRGLGPIVCVLEKHRYTSPMTKENVPTLYEWSGGAERIEALFKKFYEHVRIDATLGPVFADMPEEHFQTVAHFVSEVLGGPKLYSGDGKHNHSSMVAKHLQRHLTEPQRRRWVNLLLDTADELDMPKDPEFRSALVGYLEWGSRIAVINSASSENPVGPSAPMPHWGWGEVKGPYIP
jgi:hemoglobin